MKAMVLGVVVAAATTMPAYAFDGVTAEGAILCSSPSDYREAEMAVRSGDDAWLKSIGCDTAKAGSRIIIISDNRELSQVRWVDKGVTAWMGRWNYAMLMSDFSLFEHWRKGAESIENMVHIHIASCAKKYSSSPDFYKNYSVVFKLTTIRNKIYVKPDAFIAPETGISDDSVRIFIADAYSAFKQDACETIIGQQVASGAKIPPYVIVKF